MPSGFAVVKKGRDKQTGQVVAIKVCFNFKAIWHVDVLMRSRISVFPGDTHRSTFCSPSPVQCKKASC
jgi:hypothetical protein